MPRPTGGDQRSESEMAVSHHGSDETVVGAQRTPTASYNDSLFLGIREPVYEVVEVKSTGLVFGPRDIRIIDPSLWLTNSMPSLLVREHVILLNLGSLGSIAVAEHVLLFNYNRRGGKAFIGFLLPRLNTKSMSGGHYMPFELEVVEVALMSRLQQLEKRLMDVELQVLALLEVLPNPLTTDALEQHHISEQALVKLDSRTGALKQMLLDLLEGTLKKYSAYVLWNEIAHLREGVMILNALQLWKSKLLWLKLICNHSSEFLWTG
ncbi:hypothetical protein SAY87_013489 [Trapa incisa]|uniref:Magnesium transporter n=1 Tax=Trapa incisa TaxID=236973 RepID=A0AAN7KBZ9_9MYRT|nr:hypothetical protein SAY87_013489 [Trapa incisa]